MVAVSAAHGSVPSHAPAVREISTADLRLALAQGWQDFKDRRGDIIILGLIYPAVGLIAATFAVDRALLPLIFPLVAGLSLLGPAVASGFLELSRRREAGQDASWRHFFDPFRDGRRGAMFTLSLALVVLFFVWIGVAWVIYGATLGRITPAFSYASADEFMRQLFTTPEGWTMIVLGNLAGLILAVAVLAISLVSFPMVVDGRAHAFAAISASIDACLKNVRTVSVWGVWVAALLALASIPLFIGLAVAVPVLGYATWRLYGRLVER